MQTLYDPKDYTVHGILQARILEPFSSPGDLPNPGIKPIGIKPINVVSHIAARFFTSCAIREAFTHIKALTKCTQKALSNSNQAIGVLNLEVSMMKKAVLQNHSSPDSLTAFQWGTSTIKLCFDT